MPTTNLQPKVSKLLLNFLLNGPHETTLGILETFNFCFLMTLFLENLKFPFVPCGETKSLSYLEKERL